MRQIVIIAPTASGKTALSIKMAKKTNSIILSFDSLSVYKEIDIASAKPTKKEQNEIKHFGINEIYPNETFNVTKFLELYDKAYKYALKNKKNLIIIGGTGFYLKTLIDGISITPTINKDTKEWVKSKMQNLNLAYKFMFELDNNYMKNIASNDKYRIQKALELYKQTGIIPTQYFKKNKPKPSIKNSNTLEYYCINKSAEELKKNIAKRTNTMFENGLIDEVIYLEKKYTRAPNCMKSIGIIETLSYLDGKFTKNELIEKINTNTIKLAKQQRTFIKGQFKNKNFIQL